MGVAGRERPIERRLSRSLDGSQNSHKSRLEYRSVLGCFLL